MMAQLPGSAPSPPIDLVAWATNSCTLCESLGDTSRLDRLQEQNLRRDPHMGFSAVALSRTRGPS